MASSLLLLRDDERHGQAMLVTTGPRALRPEEYAPNRCSEWRSTMKLTRYRPAFPEMGTWPPMSDVPTRFRQMFDELFTQVPSTENFGWTPNVDIIDSDGELLLTAELPGLNREDVALEIEDGMLTLKGEKKSEKEEKTGTWRLVERSYGAFERRFTLPRAVDPAKVKAEFKDGVLFVHLPKTKEAMGKKIEIAAK